jgi:outer membrane receptor protein involved in Fe transport
MVSVSLFVSFVPSVHARDHDDDDDDEVRQSSAPADIVITAKRLDAARADVEAGLGASTFTLPNEALEARPAGETTSIARALLQAPGVAQTGKGQISIRGAQDGIQYRINNVILPDGISDLGEQLSPRLAERIELITGALPAQYGLQVGAVVNITTKNGLYGDRGQVELYGGGQGQIEPAFEFASASGSTSLFMTGSYLHDEVGLASPDGSASPNHDRTNQFEGLAFIDHVIDDESRISLIAGLSDEHFEIPEGPGLDADDPADIHPANPPNEGRLYQQNLYGALSYQHSSGPDTLLLSVFGRHSQNALRPSAIAGLFQTGLGGETASSGWSLGVQAEGAFQLGERHIVRAGGVASLNHLNSRLDAVILPAGNAQLSPQSITSFDNVHRTDASLFLQDEWKPTDQLTVNFGGRFDSISGFVDGTSFGPRLNVVWSSPSKLKLHAGYARSMVAPILFPLGHASILEGTSALPSGQPGDHLLVERDDYFDVGLQQKLDELTVGVDAFWRKADNYLSELQDGSPLLVKPFNYRDTHIRGVEFSLNYDEGPLAAWANLTFMTAKASGITSGQGYFAPEVLAYIQDHWVRPDGTQRFSASSGATYSFGTLRLGAEMLYGSGLPRTPTAKDPSPPALPGYVQVNVDLIYHMDGLGGRPLDLRLDLINAFDRRYMISEDSSTGIPQWGPRRGVFVGFEQVF